jgi:outer membrane immunogenic protein
MSVVKSVGLKSAGWALAATLVAVPLGAHAQQNNHWQGPYAGVNIGGMWSEPSAAIGLNGTGGGFGGGGAGFMGGVQAGYNWMLGPIVLGPEVDFNGSTLSSYVSGGAGASQISATQKMPWFTTWRVRAGYPVGSVMPYVTGGAVWGHQSLEGNDSANGGYFNVSNNFWTYAVGAGIEGHLTSQITAKLEYLYIGTPDTPLSSPATTSITERSIGNVIRAGLNYQF